MLQFDHEEHRRCIEIAVDVCSKSDVKVLAGAGSNATHEAIGLAKFAQAHGAHGILSVTPYYNKPTQEGLYQHYKAIDLLRFLYFYTMYLVEQAVICYLKPSLDCMMNAQIIFGVKEATGRI